MTEPQDTKAPQGAELVELPKMPHLVSLTEDIQIAHRLFLMPGLCQQIHGHSMQVTVTWKGFADSQGVFEGLDFVNMKKAFREYLKNNYDHRLLLNKNDPWASPVTLTSSIEGYDGTSEPEYLPGLQICEGDPTTENLCRYMYYWARYSFSLPCIVTIQETKSNAVTYGDFNGGPDTR